LRLSMLNLAQLLDIEDVDGFDINQPGFENVEIGDFSGTESEIYESALLLMPQVKSAELNVLYYERDLAVSKGWLSPTLSLNASWGSGYSDKILDFQSGNIMALRNQLDYSSTTSLGLNLRIPLFNNWTGQTDIKNKRIALLNSSYQLELIKNQLRKEIQQAMSDAQAALEKYRATEKTLISLEEAFSYTKSKYNLGTLTSLDYNVAKNNLTKAQSDLLQAKYNYIFSVEILDFYRGLPIKLN